MLGSKSVLFSPPFFHRRFLKTFWSNDTAYDSLMYYISPIVNGGWTEWELWSACSQVMLYSLQFYETLSLWNLLRTSWNNVISRNFGKISFCDISYLRYKMGRH
jgi:hypothetical protein